MSIRAFPKTRKEPRKRILAIPIILLAVGLSLNFVPVLRFIGTILALTGVMAIFLVGMVYADLWASAKRTKDIIKAREARDAELDSEEIDSMVGPDPFEESFGDEDR
ncbi:MAG: hypothetical protein ACFFAY_13775 [Promethearchaeota archaeon]